MTLGYGIGLPALIFAVILLLHLYLEKRRHLAVELRAWRERLDITQEEAAELLSDCWNKKYPKTQKNFAPRTIKRWEAGKAPFPQTYFNIMRIIDDEKTFDAIATRARRDNLDALDAFMGERTPSSPPRAVFMPTEAWQSFYAEEYGSAHGLTQESVQTAAQGKKKVVMMRQATKKQRRRRKR